MQLRGFEWKFDGLPNQFALFVTHTMMVFSAFELKTSTLISCSAFRTVWAHTGKEHWIANQFLPDASNVDAQCRVTIKIFFICVWVLATPWKTSSVNGFSIQMEFCLMLYCSSWHSMSPAPLQFWFLALLLLNQSFLPRQHDFMS